MNTSKRIISLLMCMLMVMSMLAVTASAAVRPPVTPIDFEFTCEGLKNAVPGSTVPTKNFFVAPSAFVIDSVGYEKDVSSYKGEIFEEGNYTVNIVVSLANGDPITEVFDAKINGNIATVAISPNIPDPFQGKAIISQKFTVSYTYIDPIELALNGYEAGKNITEITATENAEGAKFLSDMYGAGYYITDAEYNPIIDENASFEYDEQYYLAINLKALSGYGFDLTEADISLKDYVCDVDIGRQNTDELNLFFKLPKLVSPNTVSEIKLTLNGYEIGEPLKDIYVATDSEGIEISDNGEINNSVIYDSGNTPPTHNNFMVRGNYRVAVCLEVKNGYNFNASDAADIISLEGAEFVSINKKGNYYIAILQLPLLTNEKITSVDMTVTPPAANEAPIKAATAVTVPANSIGEINVSWYECDTNSNNLAEWALMEDGELFKEGKYYLVKFGLAPAEKYEFSMSESKKVNGVESNNSFGSDDNRLTWLTYGYVWYIQPHNCADNLDFIEGEAADCLNDGKIAHYVCTYASCGKKYSDDKATIEVTDTVIDAPGHNFMMTFPKADASCGAEGRKESFRVCKTCNNRYSLTDEITPLTDAYIESIRIPATGAHTYDNACDAECNLCNAPRTAPHTYDNACDAECNICKATRTPADHTGGTATCTEKAKCSVCGEAYGAVNKNNHKSLTTLKAVAATCTKEGKTEGKKCTVCGTVTVAQKPVAKKAHTLTTLKAVAATCTKEGKTEGKKCTVCGTVTVVQKTVAKKAHTYKNVTTKATLSKNGKVESKCSVCGNVSKTTTIYYPKTIKLSKASYTYDKKVKTPTVTVKDSKGNTLKKDTDYTVSYESSRKAPGKYTVKITFKGKYEGTKRLYFTIAPKATSKITATQTTTTITLKWTKVTGADGYRVYKYNSKTKKYEKLKDVTKNTLKISKLKAGTAYKYKVRAYTKDDGTIWGDYSKVFETATKCKTPSITKLTTTKGKASFTWSNVAGETGYQVYYSTKKDSGYKKVTSYKTNVVKGSKTKLKSGKKYYFKVRAYKKTASGTVYSSWSAVKSVKIK